MFIFHVILHLSYSIVLILKIHIYFSFVFLHCLSPHRACYFSLHVCFFFFILQYLVFSDSIIYPTHSLILFVVHRNTFHSSLLKSHLWNLPPSDFNILLSILFIYIYLYSSLYPSLYQDPCA